MSDKKQTAYRSAKTGEFVTRRAAERSPSTTVKERNPVGNKWPSGGSKKK